MTKRNDLLSITRGYIAEAEDKLRKAKAAPPANSARRTPANGAKRAPATSQRKKASTGRD